MSGGAAVEPPIPQRRTRALDALALTLGILALWQAVGSLTAGIAAVAQQRGLQLRSVRADVSAEMDLHGILGADPEVRNGFSGVRVDYRIDADASRAEIEALVAQSQKRSAVYDILTNPTAVTVTVNYRGHEIGPDVRSDTAL